MLPGEGEIESSFNAGAEAFAERGKRGAGPKIVITYCA